MNSFQYLILIVVISCHSLLTSKDITNAESRLNTAIIYNGCASSSAISDSPDDIKQRIDTYKVENL